MIWSTDKDPWLGYPTSLGLTIKWSLFSILRTDFTTTTTSDETFDGYVKNVKKAQTSLANLLDTLNELRVHMINQVRTVRIWNPDESRFPMVEKNLVCKWSWFQMCPEIWKPEHLKSSQMATIWPKNIWNLNKNLNGLGFQWLGLFRKDVINLWVWSMPQLIPIHSIQPQPQAN